MSAIAVDWDKSSIGKGHDFPRLALLGALIREQVSSGSVLDIGCDNGAFKSLLGDMQYTGIDARIEAIEAARSSHPNSSFICMRAEEWVPDRMFDAVVFNESLYYLQDFIAALEKFHSCLRPGGLLAISIYKHPSWFNPNHKALRQSKQFAEKMCQIVYDVMISSGNCSWNILVAQKQPDNHPTARHLY